jgi:hypothetical protein
VQGCVWFEDAFEREASTTLGDKWEEYAGDWEIDASGRLITADTYALAYPKKYNPGSMIWEDIGGNLMNVYLYTLVTGTTAGDEIVIGNDRDAPFSYIAGYYCFGLRVGGSALIWFGANDRSWIQIECSVTAAANVEHELIFDCGIVYLNGVAVMNIIGRADVDFASRLFIGSGDVFGEVRFSELTIERTIESHPSSSCPTCEDCPLFLGPSPASVEVIVAGHTGLWAVLNGTYNLDQTASYNREAAIGCLYQITGLGIIFDPTGINEEIDTLTLQINNAGYLYAEFRSTSLNLYVDYSNVPDTVQSTSCAGSDPVLDYDHTGYGGSDHDPTLTQAGSTLTINL